MISITIGEIIERKRVDDVAFKQRATSRERLTQIGKNNSAFVVSISQNCRTMYL